MAPLPVSDFICDFFDYLDINRSAIEFAHPVAVAPVHAASLRGIEAAVRSAVGFGYGEDAPVWPLMFF
jgi:hypothetical protein